MGTQTPLSIFTETHIFFMCVTKQKSNITTFAKVTGNSTYFGIKSPQVLIIPAVNNDSVLSILSSSVRPQTNTSYILTESEFSQNTGFIITVCSETFRASPHPMSLKEIPLTPLNDFPSVPLIDLILSLPTLLWLYYWQFSFLRLVTYQPCIDISVFLGGRPLFLNRIETSLVIMSFFFFFLSEAQIVYS